MWQVLFVHLFVGDYREFNNLYEIAITTYYDPPAVFAIRNECCHAQPFR